MTDLDNPAPSFEKRIFTFFLLFVTARTHMRFISGSDYHFSRYFSGIPRIRAKIFSFRVHYRLHNFPLNYFRQLAHIMPVSPGHDD